LIGADLENGKMLVLDKNNAVLVKPEYEDIGIFKENKAIVTQISGENKLQSGFVNLKGELIVDCIYDQVYDFQEGLAAVVKEGKIGFIDSIGKIIIPLEYDFPDMEGALTQTDFYGFRQGLARICKAGNWGCINQRNEMVIPFEYEAIGPCNGGRMKVEKNQRTGLMDLQGGWIIKPDYQDIKTYSEGFIAVKKNKRWGFLNEEKELVIPIKYNYVMDFQNGLAVVVNTKNKWGVINRKGKTKIEFRYEHLRQDGDIFLTEKEGKYGVINKKGKEIISPQYDDFIHRFQEGIAAIGYLQIKGYLGKDKTEYWEK
jgi:hypothetical protein